MTDHVERGASPAPEGPAPDRLDDLLHQADEALYHAKRSGRDAVALHDPSRGGATLAIL